MSQRVIIDKFGCIGAISWMSVDDLRNSGIDDLYIKSVSVYISGIGINDGFLISHNLKQKVIRMGLIDPNEEKKGAEVPLEEMVLASVEAEHGTRKLEQEYNSFPYSSQRDDERICKGVALSQRAVADLIVRYACSPLVKSFGISLDLNCDQFVDDNELRRVLEGSNIHWRKIYFLEEEGGRPIAVPWRGKQVQLCEGYGGCAWDRGLIGLQSKGFERYFSVDEQLVLTSDLIEKKAPAELETLLEFGRYEWSHDAFARKGKELTIYRGVSGLRYNEQSHSHVPTRTTDMNYEFKAVYTQKVDVPEEKKSVRERFSLSDLGDDFCRALIGKSLSEIPVCLKKGENAIRVELPGKGMGVYPVQYARPIRLLGLIGGSPSVRGIK